MVKEELDLVHCDIYLAKVLPQVDNPKLRPVGKEKPAEFQVQQVLFYKVYGSISKEFLQEILH